jgi:hypothetical protein
MKSLKPNTAERIKRKTASTKLLPPLHSKPTDWVDKQTVMECFHISGRTLQNLRSRKEIIWSKLGGKIYYNLPSFADVLEKNRRS